MEGMRETLRRSLSRSLGSLAEEDRLAAAWTVVCGRVLSGRGSIAGYSEGVVRVEVVDAVWMQQMMRIGKQLMRELGATANVPVRELRFTLQGRVIAATDESGANKRITRHKEISGE